MGGTNGVSGNGNNYKISNFWHKPSLQAGKTGQTLGSTPIKLTSNNITREALGLINPYNNADASIADAREIASNTNDIMAQLGYPNFKVAPKVVSRISEDVNGQIVSAMNDVDNEAIVARVESPEGPFAELFTKQS